MDATPERSEAFRRGEEDARAGREMEEWSPEERDATRDWSWKEWSDYRRARAAGAPARAPLEWPLEVAMLAAAVPARRDRH